MQQQPLDYESPPREPPDRIRRVVGRLAYGAWLLFGIAGAFLWASASNQSSLLRPAAIFMLISMVLAAVLTVLYGGIVVVDWARKRGSKG